MDCNKTINFFKEVKRMCKTEQCTSCPFVLGSGCKISYFFLSTTAPTIDLPTMISMVQKWSDEHPLKTYAQDFFEKFPNALKDHEGVPNACLVDIYGSSFDECYGCCIDCWNKPMNDEETEGALKERENNG